MTGRKAHDYERCMGARLHQPWTLIREGLSRVSRTMTRRSWTGRSCVHSRTPKRLEVAGERALSRARIENPPPSPDYRPLWSGTNNSMNACMLAEACSVLVSHVALWARACRMSCAWHQGAVQHTQPPTDSRRQWQAGGAWQMCEQTISSRLDTSAGAAVSNVARYAYQHG